MPMGSKRLRCALGFEAKRRKANQPIARVEGENAELAWTERFPPGQQPRRVLEGGRLFCAPP
jgi:hypothetical protein